MERYFYQIDSHTEKGKKEFMRKDSRILANRYFVEYSNWI